MVTDAPPSSPLLIPARVTGDGGRTRCPTSRDPVRSEKWAVEGARAGVLEFDANREGL